MPETEPIRRRGRRPAGEDTRAQILTAARTLFTRDGYDAVSLRAIARHAGVDPALVHHWFDGKAALFAESISVGANPAHEVARLADVPRDELGPAIVGVFLSVWDAPERRQAFVAMVRGVLSTDEALRPMREYVMHEILARLLPEPAQDHATPLRSQLLASQMIGMALGRYVLQLPELAQASPDDVVAWIGPTIQLYIDMDLSARDA